MKKIFLIILALFLFVGTSYGVKTTKVYMTDGGDKMVVASGGTLEIESGATATIANGSLAPADVAVTNTQIIVGNASGVGASVAMSGDGSLANDGTFTLLGRASRNIRTRVTLTQLNAGLELLPATAARQYRIISITMIAVGGALGTATSIEIEGTQSAGSVDLFSVAAAGLTQSTVNTIDGANTTVLADGASFAACDANTAINITATGTADTITDVDVIIDYMIE